MEDRKIKRGSINAINFIATCLFLFFAVQCSDGGENFAKKINTITANLDRAVLGLATSVNYTEYNDSSVYYSSTEFRPSGMAGLYNLTNMFIDTFVPEDILMEGIILINDNQIKFNNPAVSDVLSYYRGLVAIALFLALCVVLFPLCGLCFCCCRCCGNCGARSQPADKKKDLCKKITQGTLLIVLGTGLLFCVVCAFGSNQQLQDGIDEFPHNIKNSVKDTSTFLDSTTAQIENLLITNYYDFSTVLKATLNDSTEIVTKELENYSNATSMLSLYAFANGLTGINNTLISLKSDTNKLRVYASQLNDAIRKVKRDLQDTLYDCQIPQCVALRSNISLLQTNIDFNSLPDLTNDIRSFDDLPLDKIQDAASDGNNELEKIKTSLEKGLKEGIKGAITQIDNSGDEVKKIVSNISSIISDVQRSINNSATSPLIKAEEYIKEYGKYRNYVGLAISCVLLLITVCIALGLICGICGKRPDGYTDNCCNKGTGSQFLLCAVIIMFLFGFIISVITLASIVVGVISDKVICSTIRNPDPEKSNIMELLDKGIQFNEIDIKPSNLLQNCYQNQSIYNTLNLTKTFNLTAIRNNFNIDEQLNEFNIDGVIPDNFSILTKDDINTLNQLKNFTPSNLDKFSDELLTNFTNYDLTLLSSKLEEIINILPQNETDIKSRLQLSVLHLNTYDEKLIQPMKNLANQVVLTASDLDNKLKMNKTNFSVAVDDLIHEIQSASDFLMLNGSQELKRITSEFKDVILSLVNGYLDRVGNYTLDKIGTCGPLSLVINATLTSTCDKVLTPWNGFWFSLFWTIILYVITIIVAVKLANLYQKCKPYGQYVEARGGKRGKKKGKKSKRYDERPPHVPHEVVTREYATGSHPPDGRYADMAPKNYRSDARNPLGNYSNNAYLKSTRF